MAYTNKLATETSPYLLQHAHNPVNWYPWGEEALTKARQEDKPILVSIGYAACHWCHVMERESFEDEPTATLMNDWFVNIKIDREERPDLDHIYMDAVQALTGSGGWPLNVFLTPDGKPFYGGTYFPPQAAFNRPSWKDVLTSVYNAFRDKRKEIDVQAENLTAHLQQSNSFGQQQMQGMAIDFDTTFSKEKSGMMFSNIMKIADKKDGGFGNAPKFPQTFTIQYLLHYYYHSNNSAALQQACHSLDKMVQGGIYDQVGGGFARYSTDAEWLVPHFEKMLYDNALLVNVLAQAYQLTNKPLYRRAIEQTLAFAERELYSPEGGFYAALDADSEGEEGRFYVWEKTEVESLLGEKAALFCDFFDITPGGNWEHKNILNIRQAPEAYAAAAGMTEDALWQVIDECREKLLQQRSLRVRPLTDDKILLGWNALMITAYCKAFAALGYEHYKAVAVRSMEFLWSAFRAADRSFYHTYKKNTAKYPAFLDDYAYLIEALIHLQEITGDSEYLKKAGDLTAWVVEFFSEADTGFFFFTHRDQQDVIVRKKEVYDGAVPSGNAVMAINLYYLGVVFDNAVWRDRAAGMCASLNQAVNRYPSSFGVWAMLTQALTYPVPEIAIIGKSFENSLNGFLRIFIPFCIVQSAPHENNEFPLLSQKPDIPETQFYLCRQYACQRPVNELDDLLQLLGNV